MNNNFINDSVMFNNIVSELDDLYHKASLKVGLSDSISSILYTLYQYDNNLPLSDLIKISGLRPQTVNSAIRSLENKGYLFLEMINQKSKRVVLTPTGIELSKNTIKKIIDIENSIYKEFTEEEIKQYIELTNKFLISFKRKIEIL